MRRYRAMTDAERVRLAASMSDDVRRIALDGIRARHPEYTPAELCRALVTLLYGGRIAARAWPGAPPTRP